MPRSEEPTASTVAACVARESSTAAASTEPGKTDTEGSAGRGVPPVGASARGSTRIGAGTLGGRRPAGSAAGDESEGSHRPDGTGGGEQERATRPPAGWEARRSPAEPTRNTGRVALLGPEATAMSRTVSPPSARADRKRPRSEGRCAARRTARPDATAKPRTVVRRAREAGGRARCRASPERWPTQPLNDTLTIRCYPPSLRCQRVADPPSPRVASAREFVRRPYLFCPARTGSISRHCSYRPRCST